MAQKLNEQKIKFAKEQEVLKQFYEDRIAAFKKELVDLRALYQISLAKQEELQDIIDDRDKTIRKLNIELEDSREGKLSLTAELSHT